MIAKPARRQKPVTADELRKSAIKSSVQRARRALSEGLQQRLASLGVFADGKRTSREQIPDQWTAQRERPGIEAALARWEQQGFDSAGAVDRFVRESSYTWLNRLAAIRALEVRGLIPPIASLDESGTQPAIMASLAQVSPALSQAREVAEALLWQQLFGELALQVGALFDPLDPHGVFPGSSAVLGALQALSELDAQIWREDDTLGWLYQFFTTKEERATLRKKKGAAFTADDLGPINQFYTPDWVVRFLVDNTLGALWRRMHPQTKIGQFCTLLLPATDDDTPIAQKGVRELKIIDPACGAMHFGVYAFDVLRHMYEEEGIEAARDVPRLILEHNLVGIDIDRRAIQIASLNLYLKAATALAEMGQDAPHDLHLNLGCADGALPSQEQLATLRAEISDPALKEATDVALSSLRYLHAVGSLLDIEADVREALSHKSKPLPKGVSPLPGILSQVGMAFDDEPTQLDALVSRAREIAEAALRADDVAGALAAEDAMLAAKVLRLVNQRYDVVLMNPPYGELMPPATKEYLHRRYPKSKSDIYGAFFELAFRLAEGGGVVGALTSKTFLYLDTFKHIRKLFLETGRMSALIDCGDRVLYESDVDVSQIIGWTELPRSKAFATVLRLVRERDRETCAVEVVQALNRDPTFTHDVLYSPFLSDLRKLPTETIAYWAPPALLAAYEKYPALEPTYGEVRQGLATGDDERFLRYWWEVPEDCIGEGKRWVPFAKGGDYSPYYESLLRVIDWTDDGAAVKKSPSARPQNQQYYFREGITYPRIADRFHARQLRAGAIFADTGPSIFGNRTAALLGFLNSRVAQVLLMAQSVTRHFEVGQVRRLCVPDLNGPLGEKLAELAKHAIFDACDFATGNELDQRFQQTWCDQVEGVSLVAATNFAVELRQEFLRRIGVAQEAATKLVGRVMDFTEEDWDQIRRTFGEEIRRDERARIGRADDPLQTPAEHACRCISSLTASILRCGDIMTSDDLYANIRTKLAARFNEDPIREFADLVGKPLQVWLKTDYHLFHLHRHERRPFILRLASANGELVLYINALAATTAQLRNALAEVIGPIERSAQSSLAATGLAPDERLRQQKILEDASFIAEVLIPASNTWDGMREDVRHRIELLLPLATYLKKVSARGKT